MRNLISKKSQTCWLELPEIKVLLAGVNAIYLVIDLESNILRFAPINILSLFWGDDHTYHSDHGV
jgi:hypothetical protein